MIKTISIYLVSFVFLLIISFKLHELAISGAYPLLRFSLFNIYLFNTIFSFALCTVFLVLSKNEKYKFQIGFLYLVSMVFKLLVFSLVFRKSILVLESISRFESISLLVPIAIFLTAEVYFVSRILRQIS